MLTVAQLSASYGSKKGLLKYYRYLLLYNLGCRFGTNNITQATIERVVFVCKGNICRSAYAEAYAKRIGKVPCISLGLDTTQGKPANERVIKWCTTRGLSLESHRTTELAKFEVRDTDVFVCMEPSQSEQLRKILPNANIQLLGLSGKPKIPYIHDPYSSSDDYLNHCLEVIEKKVIALMDTLYKPMSVK